MDDNLRTKCAGGTVVAMSAKVAAIMQQSPHSGNSYSYSNSKHQIAPSWSLSTTLIVLTLEQFAWYTVDAQ